MPAVEGLPRGEDLSVLEREPHLLGCQRRGNRPQCCRSEQETSQRCLSLDPGSCPLLLRQCLRSNLSGVQLGWHRATKPLCPPFSPQTPPAILGGRPPSLPPRRSSSCLLLLEPVDRCGLYSEGNHPFQAIEVFS